MSWHLECNMTGSVLHGEFAVAALKLDSDTNGLLIKCCSPRRIRRGRIEAFQHTNKCTCRNVVLHGEFAVAALKQSRLLHTPRRCHVLHGEFAVAALKHRSASITPNGRLGSPRRIRRGRIEATPKPSVAFNHSSFSTANSPWPH